MRVLLDTHVWLWALREPQRLGPAAAVLEDPDNELCLSAISVWEAVVLAGRGRIEVTGDPGTWVRDLLERFPLRDLPVTRSVAIASRSVDLPHADPADRFIVATATVHDLTLATADARLLGAGACRLLPAG